MTQFGNVLKGVAIGDAWGDPNEFRSIKAITQDNPMGPDLPDELRITDDTQMTFVSWPLRWKQLVVRTWP